MANTLSTLKFVAAEKPSTYSQKPTDATRRAKLVKAIDEQVKLIQGEQSGKPYIPQVNKKDDGGNITVVNKKIKAWYWKDASGVFCNIRYGSTVLAISGDAAKSTFKVANLDALAKSLNVVKTAVNAGELDKLIAAAAVKKAAKAK